ncbi:unnamed protein product [Adineta steineri]|uniref:NHL repeat containing protein n=1 Tax=Adineta steineri TaxID=433720 RepID=A0A813WCP6_9BILA|nr:unnamed protein product [Adineta steineri]CAF4134290.1 unnamed protein product [Adineta steineri]
MNINNRVGIDESSVVNPNTTRLGKLREHFRKRRLIWIICSIIFMVLIIVISTTVALMNKTKREKTSTMETITEIATTTSTTTAITTTITTETTSEQLFAPVIIDKNTKWKQSASTVAGGHGQGHELNQLNHPQGFYVDDDDDSIYIADTNNHRIVQWKFGVNNGEIVAGKKGNGNGIDQLHTPMDVILNKEKKYLIICDMGNYRVIKWSRQNSQDQEILISSTFCWGLAIDNNGDLYISNWMNDEVRRWEEGDTEGTVVAGGNGYGNSCNQLDQAKQIFVDINHSVYVADHGNNRVMKWMKDATEGILIAPGNVSNQALLSMLHPIAVIVDHTGNIYISDDTGHSIKRWLPNAIEGIAVVGKEQSGSESTHLSKPLDLSFDRHGNLYVIDKENNRIQKFLIDLD